MIKGRKVFWIGLVILILGWIICLHPYFSIIAWPIFLIGVIIIWFSNKSIITKIVLTIVPVLLWYAAMYLLWYVNITANTSTPSTFLIPENFRGQIVLIFGEDCGQLIPKINGRKIYKIPETGIMIFKDKIETGFLDYEYFFIDKNENKLGKIDFLIPQNFNEKSTTKPNLVEPPRDKVGIFLNGTGSRRTNKIDTYEYEELNVNSYEDYRTYDSDAHEVKVNSILTDCRNYR